MPCTSHAAAVSEGLHYGVQEPGDNEDKNQPRRSIVPETNNTRREDNKVGDAAAATEATCYDDDDDDDDDDSKELKGSKVRETDNSEVENNKVHGGFDAEEKQEKEEDNDGDNDDDDDDDSDEDDQLRCHLYVTVFSVCVPEFSYDVGQLRSKRSDKPIQQTPRESNKIVFC